MDARMSEYDVDVNGDRLYGWQDLKGSHQSVIDFFFKGRVVLGEAIEGGYRLLENGKDVGYIVEKVA